METGTYKHRRAAFALRIWSCHRDAEGQLYVEWLTGWGLVAKVM
jgi:hypothetical protein